MDTDQNQDRTALRVRLTGRVQGVGMRYMTQEHAQLIGLTGWVRNRTDGSVELWLEGKSDTVQGMLDWLRNDPGWARVEGLTTEPAQPEGHSEFRITR